MWIQQKANSVAISCQIQPGASRTEVVGLHGEPPRLKIRVAAPPVDGNANAELVIFLSKKLRISKSRIQIVSGHSGKFKDISIGDMTVEEVRKRLIEASGRTGIFEHSSTA